MITSIFMDPNNGSNNRKPELTLVLGDHPVLWETREDLGAGDYDYANSGDPGAVKISWFLESGFNQNDAGYLYTFHALLLRMLLVSDGTDAGTTAGDTVDITVTTMDDTTPTTATSSLTVDNPPKKMYNRLLGDVVAEKIKLKLEGSNSVLIRRLLVWATEKAQTRPRN